MAAYSTALLAPLVAELSTTRVRLVEQAETIGSLRAQLAAAEEWIHSLEALQQPQEGPPEARRTAQDPDPTMWGTETPITWWRRWWAWALLAL
jgi:hypothetical protein